MGGASSLSISDGESGPTSAIRRLGLDQQVGTHHADLEARRVRRIADERIGEPEADAVHRAGGRHAERHEADAAEILQRVEQAGAHDLQRAHDLISSDVAQRPVERAGLDLARDASNSARSMRWKVSESPGARNTGCSRRWSNIQSGVRPIRCQPPGLSNG